MYYRVPGTNGETTSALNANLAYSKFLFVTLRREGTRARATLREAGSCIARGFFNDFHANEGPNPSSNETVQFLVAATPPRCNDGLLSAEYVAHLTTKYRPRLGEIEAELERRLGDIAAVRAIDGSIKAPRYTSAALHEYVDKDAAALRRGLEVQESGFAALGEPILGLGFSTEVTTQAFQLEEGQIAGPIQTPSGPAFVTVTEIQAPYVPPLEEVRERVRDDVIRRKAFVTAQERATAVAAQLRSANDFKAAAEAEALVVNDSDLIARGATIPGVGLNIEVEELAFSLAVGETSGPVLTGNSAIILHVHEHEEASQADFRANLEQLRNEILADRQGQFFAAYMENAKTRITININMAAFAQAIV